MGRWRTAPLLVALVALAGTASGAPQPKPNIDPQADRMLRQMTDFLAGLKSFSVRTAATDEVVLKSGQKLEVASESQVSVQRPNHLRSQQVGAANGLGFFYDGKTMTITCPATRSFSTVPAPPTLDATIDEARKQFRIEAPGADLLYSRPYEILTEQVTGGRFIGRETVDGMPVNHLAFEGEEIDWQIWIKEGPEPLPLRFSIVSKTVKNQPEFTVTLTDWKVGPVEPSTFEFKAPAGAQRVQTLPASCGVGR